MLYEFFTMDGTPFVSEFFTECKKDGLNRNVRWAFGQNGKGSSPSKALCGGEQAGQNSTCMFF